MKITARISAYARDQLLLLSSLVLVFGALAVLSVFFFSGEKKRALLYIELKVEETASALLDYYRQGMTPRTDEFERITGFGIYKGDGAAAATAGRAPDNLELENIEDRSSIYSIDWEEGAVSVVKPLGMFPAFVVPPGGSARMRGMSRQQHIAAIFIEMAVPDLLGPYRWYTIGQIGVPAILIALFILILYILIRNREYRRKIDSQRHLVHLGEAARTLSHEIRNPLSAIQIQTAILRKTSHPAGEDSLRVIDEEVRRLTLLTERVGDFLRNPEGRPERFSAGEYVNEIVKRLPWEIKYSTSAGRDAAIHVDRERFRSVVENLVRNAAESAAASAAVRAGFPIEVTVAAERGEVVITVSDRGSGISSDIRERIFDPFFTTKESGSGIGLGISRRFVEGAGGFISLDPRDGGGTVATVKLPRARP